MNSASSGRRAGAFTLVEMLVVMGIIAILAALLLPAVERSQMRAKRIVCENRLHELGIAFQSFAHDHNSKFPMQVPGSDGGSQEFAKNGYLVNGPFYFEFRHFQPLADILETPRTLVCPTDERMPAKAFATLQNSNVSYFVGVNAEYSEPMSILSGDGNLAVRSTIVQGVVGERLKWTAQLHQYKGNVLFADGHVEEWGSGKANSLAVAEDFVLPTVNDGHQPGQPNQPNQPYQPVQTTTTTTQSGNSDDSNPSSTWQTEDGVGTSKVASPASRPAEPEINAPAKSSPIPANRSESSADESKQGESAGAVVAVKNVSVTTNSSETHVSKFDDDSITSRFNRRATSVFGGILFGAYFLFLLLFLLYVAYRMWRWWEMRKRKRALRGPEE